VTLIPLARTARQFCFRGSRWQRWQFADLV